MSNSVFIDIIKKKLYLADVDKNLLPEPIAYTSLSNS